MHSGVQTVVKDSGKNRSVVGCPGAKAASGVWTKPGGFIFACAQMASKIPKSRHLDLPSFGHLPDLWVRVRICCVFMSEACVRPSG